MYFQLASSNYSYIVELYNFQLNAVNKTIHTRDTFSYIATFYKLECLSQYLVHFSTYHVTFQTRPCIFSTKLMIFCLHYSDHWSRPGRPGDIWNNQGLSKCYQPRPSAQLISFSQTSPLIISGYHKTSSHTIYCLILTKWSKTVVAQPLYINL